MTSLELSSAQAKRANNKYKNLYDNNLYCIATDHKSEWYTNALIDEALAICGHPGFKISNRQWSKEAIEFLRKFV